MGIGYRCFGYLSCGDGDGLRFTWLQVVPQWGITFKLNNWGRHDDDPWCLVIGLVFVAFYLKLPFRASGPLDGENQAWGFSWRWFEGGYIALSWGLRYRGINLPWSLNHYRTSWLMADHVWRDEPRDLWRLGDPDGWAKKEAFEALRWSQDYPYRYVLKSGTVQERIATVTLVEREWRRRWLPFTALFRKVSRNIHIVFSDEVGERSGSWKGGTVGCEYQIKLGESPEQCLRRMERERKF